MNAEIFYIQTEDQMSVISAIKERLSAEAISDGTQLSSPLPSSYDALLRTDPKRKVLVSPVQQGWVTVLESREVVDFELARRLSEQFKTKVIIIQLAECAGGRGVVTLKDGAVVSSDYSEDDDDPLGSIQSVMTQNGILEPLWMFREAIQLRDQGWRALTR
ncbi:MAG: hypothetical protein RIS79_744 [Verrucomicrobiota bacterium]|jgi:hypothetical protein